jgi:hypothetical protein
MTGHHVHDDRLEAVVTLASEMTGRSLEALCYQKNEQSVYLRPAPGYIVHLWQPDLDCPGLHIVNSFDDGFETYDDWRTASPFVSDEEAAEIIAQFIWDATYMKTYSD